MTKPAERSAARLAAAQALYQMDLSGKTVVDALAEFEAFWIGREVEGIEFKPSDIEFFRNVISGVVQNQRAIDVKIDKAGLYPFVSHSFASVDMGQVGLLKVGDVHGTMSH